MFSNRLWRILSSLWLEFWLPLPLLGLLFWLSGNSTIDRVFSQPYTMASTLKLLADPPTRVNLTVANLSITARLYKSQGLTEVEIQSIAPAKTIKLKYLLTDVNRLETKISQKLGLSRQEVRKLIRYINIYSSSKEKERSPESEANYTNN
jgi:hypothetical protein